MHKAGDAGLKNSVTLKLCSIVGVSFKASRERKNERERERLFHKFMCSENALKGDNNCGVKA